MITEGTPVILMILDDQHASLMNTAAAEVRARGAYTIIITDNEKMIDRNNAHEVLIYLEFCGSLFVNGGLCFVHETRCFKNTLYDTFFLIGRTKFVL